MNTRPSFVDFLDPESKDQLETIGFVTGWLASKDQLLDLAKSLGTPRAMRSAGELIEELRPQEEGMANKNSLSSRHGKRVFPFHTDCAFWLVPPRYLILRATGNSSGTPTRIAQVDWLNDAPDLLERARTSIFKVINGRQSFLSPILERNFLRFDRDCMIPGTSGSHTLFQELDAAIPQSKILDVEWSDGFCLVIDNWRVLHGRSSCEDENGTRVLNRVLVMGGNQC